MADGGLQQVADVAQNFVADQVPVAVVDVLEIVHVADHDHAFVRVGPLDQPGERGLVEQAGQAVEVERLRALAPQVIEFAHKVAHAVDLAFAPHRHGGEGQHAVQREIDIGFVVLVDRPPGGVLMLHQVQQNTRVLEKCSGQYEQGKAEEARAHSRGPAQGEEVVQVDEAQHQRGGDVVGVHPVVHAVGPDEGHEDGQDGDQLQHSSPVAHTAGEAGARRRNQYDDEREFEGGVRRQPAGVARAQQLVAEETRQHPQNPGDGPQPEIDHPRLPVEEQKHRPEQQRPNLLDVEGGEVGERARGVHANLPARCGAGWRAPFRWLRRRPRSPSGVPLRRAPIPCVPANWSGSAAGSGRSVRR